MSRRKGLLLLPTVSSAAEYTRSAAQRLAVLDACHGFECDRLRWRLPMAECAQESWLLRAAFQAVAHQHCHAHAASASTALVPVFQAALPSRKLALV